MSKSLQIDTRRFVFLISIIISSIFSIQLARLQVRVLSNDHGHENPSLLVQHNPLVVPREETEHTASNETSMFCQTRECWQSLARSLSLLRIFPDRKDHAWLVQEKSGKPLIDDTNNRTYSDAGILYVKNFKAASSTAAGVALRLVYRLPRNISSHGWVRFHHTPGYVYRNRHPVKSFLFTSVRDPASRALSRIFYTHISHHGYDPNDDPQMLTFLRDTDSQYGSVRHVGGGYQVWYTHMEGDHLPRSWGPKMPSKVQQRQVIHLAVQQILKDYDFILVAERLDESIVVMALLMNVSLDDVLVQNAKESSTDDWYYFKFGKLERCKRPIRAFRSPAIVAHLESDEWLAKNYGDYLLHAAAILSLEATMDRLGRERVARALHVYRSLQLQVTQECRNQTIYHCSDAGNPQRPLSKKNCYSDDSGCGYQCIDSYLAKLPEPMTTRIF